MVKTASKETDKVKAAAAVLHRHIFESGWASRKDLLLVADEHGFDVDLVHKSLSLLSRNKHITQKPGADPAEMGWETLHEAGKTLTKFGRPSAPMTLRMLLKTASHGPISLDGHWFNLERDEQGLGMCRPAGFRAMIRKAHEKLGLGVEHEAEKAITLSAIYRVSVRFLGVSLNGHEEPVVSITRPVARGKAVGELRHESFPPGSTIDWILRWPMPPYTTDAIAALLDECQYVGFSAAGNGRGGGVSGVFQWVPFNELTYKAIPILAAPAKPKKEKKNGGDLPDLDLPETSEDASVEANVE